MKFVGVKITFNLLWNFIAKTLSWSADVVWTFHGSRYEPLFEAVRENDLQKVADEIRKGIDVNTRADLTSALHIAALRGKLNQYKS